MGSRTAMLLGEDDTPDAGARSRTADLLEQASPDAGGGQAQPYEPDFVRYSPPPAPPESDEQRALKMFLASRDGDVPGVDENVTPEGSARVGGMLNAYAGGVTGHLDQALPYVGSSIKDSRAQFAKDEPALAGGADLVGTLASPIGKVARAERLVGNMVAQAVNAGALGTARRFGDQQDGEHDVLKAFVDSADDAKTGALIGGGAHALGELASTGAEGAHWLKNYLRRTAMGVQAGDVSEEIAARGTGEGLRYSKEELSQLPEKLGLSNWFKLNSTSDYATKAEALRKEGGALKGSALDRADAVVPPEQIDLAKDDILARLVASGEADERAYSGVSSAPAYEDLTTRLQNRVPSTPSELDAMKQQYEGNSYALATAPAMERGSAAANKTAADETRMRLGGIISGANRLDPGIAQDFERGSQQFGDAATVEDIAKRAAAKGMTAPLIGGAVGGLAGWQTQHDLEGAGMGAAAGALATRGIQNYGADFGANVMRGVEPLLRGTGSALSGIGQSGGAIAAGGGSMMGSSPRDVQQTAAADGNGAKLPGVINQVLMQNPAALGRWRAEFETAGKTPGAISALLLRLENDREWRQTMKRQLMQLTGDSR